MMDWSERGNIRKRGPSWEPFRKNSTVFGANRRTSHGSKKEETLRRPTEVPEERERSTI